MTENDVVSSEPKGPRIPLGKATVISSATRVTAAIMLAILAVLAVVDYLSWIGKIGDVGDIALLVMMLAPIPLCLMMVSVASRFGKGVVRAQWMLFGVGMGSVGIGSLIFVALYLITGKDPYPSVGDVFTLAGYALFAGALTLAIRAYKGVLDLRRPMIIAGVICAAVLALVCVTVIGPYVIFAPTEAQSLATRVFNTLYPVLDVLMLAPAIALGLLLSKLGAGRIAWPWWFVVAATSILAITDTVFAYAGYVGHGRTPVIDAGYALAPMLLGFSVLVARDVYRS